MDHAHRGPHRHDSHPADAESADEHEVAAQRAARGERTSHHQHAGRHEPATHRQHAGHAESATHRQDARDCCTDR